MMNAVAGYAKEMALKAGAFVADFVFSLILWAAFFFLVWLAWKGVVFVAMLLPDGVRNYGIGVASFGLLAVVLWKLKETLALLAVICHVFS